MVVEMGGCEDGVEDVGARRHPPPPPAAATHRHPSPPAAAAFCVLIMSCVAIFFYWYELTVHQMEPGGAQHARDMANFESDMRSVLPSPRIGRFC